MSVPTYKYSGVVYTATADQKTFALTTSEGNSIGYLKQEHIGVWISADSGDTWTGLSIDTDYVFADPATSIVLNTGAAAGTLVQLKRTTPMDDDYIDFQAGSLLTAAELNLFDTWQLYIDQELEDKTSNISSTLPGSYVTQLVAGSNITLSPADGKGVVTINGEAGGGDSPTNTDQLPEGNINLYYTDARVESYVSGAGYIKDAGVTKIRAGSGVILNPTAGVGEVTISAVGGGGSGFDYKGAIDATGPAPAGPENGDLYVNTATSGVVGSGWTGIVGDALSGNERLIYQSDTSTWAMLVDNGVPEAPNDGKLYGRKDQTWEAFTVPVDPVQSDWDVTDSASLAFIKNKPTLDLQTICEGGNVTDTTIQAAGFRIDQLPTLP